MVDRGCDEVRELLPEVALAAASGDQRARVLAHVDRCHGCRVRLERAVETADELLLLAPQHEPSPGFEARVLAAMRPPRRSRRTAAVLLAAAAALVVAVTAVSVRSADPGGQQTAAQQQVGPSNTSSLRTAALTTSTGSAAGRVFGHQGEPSWIFMTVHGVPSGSYAVSVVTENGKVRPVGWCDVRHGTASWGTAVDVPIRSIDHLEMAWAGTVLTARFAAAG